MINFDLNWYDSLLKSYLTPSANVFIIAWSIIYITIVASFILFISDGIKKEKKVPIFIFLAQIILNMLWSPIFFIAHSVIFAFIIVVLLIITLMFNIILFWKHSKISAILLIPYLLWIIFAGYLNFIILKLN